MNQTECKFCGFTGESVTEFCSICGNRTEYQNPPVATPTNPPVSETAPRFQPSNNNNIAQNSPVRVSICADCGTQVPGIRRLCGFCEQKGEKTGFNFLRLALILFPLSIILLLTLWLSYTYLEDPAKKTVREFETVTGITKDLRYDNYRITGTGVLRVRSSEPNELGKFQSGGNNLAFEMIFTKSNQFYVRFYRDPKEASNANSSNTVYEAGSNGYRHWQSVLAWSNLGVNQTYKHRVKDTEGFSSILHKNILLGLSDFKSFDETITSECQAVTPEAARYVFMPKLYTIEGKQHTAHTCENFYLSVHDNKGGSSVLGFDPLTGVLLTERANALIEDKNASVEIEYGAFKKFSIKVKSGGSEEPKVVLIPTGLNISINIGNQHTANIKLAINNLETGTAVDPLIFEKPIL